MIIPGIWGGANDQLPECESNIFVEVTASYSNFSFLFFCFFHKTVTDQEKNYENASKDMGIFARNHVVFFLNNNLELLKASNLPKSIFGIWENMQWPKENGQIR